jgi:tetratricopeptide (TPR) repeat protein
LASISLLLFFSVLLILMAALSASAAADSGRAATNPTAALLLAATNPAVEKEFSSILAAEEAAEAEVSAWMESVRTSKTNLTEAAQADLDRRRQKRFEQVRHAFVDFLGRYPRHARALSAYGNFLRDQGDEAGAQAQWEAALAVDPANPDVRHSLACCYTESGQAKRAFEFFAKAIELNPSDPVYYWNFANATYVLRSQAAALYRISEQDVYAKVLALYGQSTRLDPTNLTYATDLAQTYYSIRPFPAGEALKSWHAALSKAHTPLEYEEIYVHLARVEMLGGNLARARDQLAAVTNAALSNLKSNLLRAIASRETEKGTAEKQRGSSP